MNYVPRQKHIHFTHSLSLRRCCRLSGLTEASAGRYTCRATNNCPTPNTYKDTSIQVRIKDKPPTEPRVCDVYPWFLIYIVAFLDILYATGLECWLRFKHTCSFTMWCNTSTNNLRIFSAIRIFIHENNKASELHKFGSSMAIIMNNYPQRGKYEQGVAATDVQVKFLLLRHAIIKLAYIYSRVF